MGTSPSRFGDCGSKCPVENVTFFDVLQFVAKLNDQPAATLRYRLPTEAEWEYACRAGTTGPFSTGENLTTAQANYKGQMPYASFPAGEFRQQHDRRSARSPPIRGDCPTCTATSGSGPRIGMDRIRRATRPTSTRTAPAQGTKRVIRGGSWFFDANSARCGLRYTHSPQDKGFSLGFRVAADAVAR